VPFYPPDAPTAPAFAHLLRSFAQADTPPTFDLLDQDDIQQACHRHGVHFGSGPDEVWSPALTLWTFLWQVVGSAKTCTAACARALTWRLALGLPPCSTNTGAYCKARHKLPEPLLRQLTLDLADRLEDYLPRRWLWRGRHVRIVDGTVCTAADTPANQQVFPQRDRVPPGAGFPLVRLVVLFSLATACCTNAAIGPYQGKGAGETTLARGLLDRLLPGEVLLGDRLFATYWLIAWVLARQADAVFRLHAHRGRDGNSRSSRLVQVLGVQDNLVVWQRPRRPEWLDEATYAQMPQQLRLRIVWRHVAVPGFRTEEVALVTTLTDAGEYAAEELVGLYRQRWAAELDLRSLKQTMKMEHLVCKSPDMVRKEVWAHLLGYNLIRATQAQAAQQQGALPRRLSFAAAKQTLEQMRELLTWAEGTCRAAVVRALWVALSEHEVAERPDRVEPRRIKRGPKQYPRLRESRTRARQRLLEATTQQ
jgi:putative transposase